MIENLKLLMKQAVIDYGNDERTLFVRTHYG